MGFGSKTRTGDVQTLLYLYVEMTICFGLVAEIIAPTRVRFLSSRTYIQVIVDKFYGFDKIWNDRQRHEESWNYPSKKKRKAPVRFFNLVGFLYKLVGQIKIIEMNFCPTA
jgi:hypothetical protein